MFHQNRESYEFGEFRLDVSERLLVRSCGDERVPLSDKAFGTLCLLVRHAGHLVTKDELLSEVWAEQIVEENSVDKSVSAIRHTLGEQRHDGRRFIETVRGRGYRFVAEVKRVAVEGEAKAAAEENIKLTTSTLKPQAVESNEQDEHLRREPIGNVVALADWRREINEANQTNGAAPEINPPLEVGQSINVKVDDQNPTESLKTGQAEAVKKPEVARSQSKKTRLRVYAVAGLLLVAAFTGITYLLNLYLTPTQMKFQAGNLTRLTATSKIINAAVSPDGKLVAYIQKDNQEEQSFWLKHLVSEGNVNIIPSGKISYDGLTFSPDNNYIYYIANNSLYQMPVLGGMPRKVLDKVYAPRTGGGGISFSPDGKQFAFLRQTKISETTTERSIVIADANGTNEQTLFARQTPTGLVFLQRTLSWSPDGKTIIAIIFEQGSNVLAVNVADKSVVKILPDVWSDIRQVTWLPDSKSFLVVGKLSDAESGLHQIWQISYPGGEARRVNVDFNNYSTVSLTADGHFLVATRTEQVAHIWTMPSDDASQLKQITSGFEKYDGVYDLAWLPDGRIMYNSLLGGKQTVSVMNANGSNSTQLISGVITATVSPDGRFLVYQKGSSRSGDIGLYRFDLSETSEIRLTNGIDIFPTFSPDGKYIVFKRFDDQKEPILRVGINRGEPNLITDNPNLNYPSISPDGKTVALANQSTNNLVLLPIEGGEPIKKFNVKFNRFEGICCKITFQWTPDGRGVNYFVLKDNVSNIWQQPIDGGEPQQVTDFKDGLIFNYAFSPDGKQLALSRGTVNSDVVLIENQK